ncbi:MAG: hypothetical protein ACTSYL_08375 [Candidatus Thorarchaeota archaeon]
MRELRGFLTVVLDAKRQLKEIYYTTRNAETKADAKDLVASVIGLQKSIERILEMSSKTRLVAKTLADRRAEVNLRQWKLGLPRRVKDYKSKYKSLKQEHLHRYQKSLMEYIQTIGLDLASWINDIETLIDLPRPPKE